MRKLLICGVFVALAMSAGVAAARPTGSNGQIAFARFNPALGDTQAYVINPDGTNERLVQGADGRLGSARRGSRTAPISRSVVRRDDPGRVADHQPRRRHVPRRRRAGSEPVQSVRDPVPGRDAASLRDVQRGRKPERHPSDPLLGRRAAFSRSPRIPAATTSPAAGRRTASGSCSTGSARTATRECSSST